MNGMIAQVVRGAGHLSPTFQQQLKRWLLETVQPLLEQQDALAAENASLREQLANGGAMPMKRGPGRPRKDEAVSA